MTYSDILKKYIESIEGLDGTFNLTGVKLVDGCLFKFESAKGDIEVTYDVDTLMIWAHSTMKVFIFCFPAISYDKINVIERNLISTSTDVAISPYSNSKFHETEDQVPANFEIELTKPFN